MYRIAIVTSRNRREFGASRRVAFLARHAVDDDVERATVRQAGALDRRTRRLFRANVHLENAVLIVVGREHDRVDLLERRRVSVLETHATQSQHFVRRTLVVGFDKRERSLVRILFARVVDFRLRAL